MAAPGPRRRPPRAAARLFAFDRRLGVRRVAGADEAGRGCLAGPLVAAAVCLDLERLPGRPRRALGGLDDSKRLGRAAREGLARAILLHAERVVVVSADAATIDRDGLHRTNLRLLGEALEALSPAADLCLVDGFALGQAAPAHRPVVGGDRRSAAIAAASIVAKTVRDRLMAGPLAAAHPGYGFERHVGYATAAHLAALRRLGPSPVHRRSFRSAAYGDLTPDRALPADGGPAPATSPPPP